MLGLATVVATLLRLRARACVVLAYVAAMLCGAPNASALESAQTKTRVWDFSFAPTLNVCPIGSASPRTHLENQRSSAELASASPHAARGVTALSKAGQGKIPSSWGRAAATKKGVGVRWTDPTNKGNGVRIDAGNPANSQVTQQVDHVIVRHNGRVIGRNGKPITGSIADNAAEAHIPLSEWQTWSKWFAL